MREDVSSTDKDCKLLLLPRSTETKGKDKKKKKKKSGSKKKRHSTSTHNSEDAEKAQSISLPPETLPVSLLPPQCQGQLRGQLPKLRACSRKDGEKGAGSGRRSKKQPRDSMAPSTAPNKMSGGGAPRQGDVSELSAQGKESLRWEGVLEDPQAEERRLELYRANRRQRYLAHRQALLEETQAALRQAFPKEDKEVKA